MVTIEIKCRDCERITEYDEDDFHYGITCRECGGYFDKVENKEYLDDEEDYDNDEDGDEEIEDYNEEPEVKRIFGIPIDSDSSPQEVQKSNSEKFNPESKTRFD